MFWHLFFADADIHLYKEGAWFDSNLYIVTWLFADTCTYMEMVHSLILIYIK